MPVDRSQASPAALIAASVDDDALGELLALALARNPEVAAMAAQARAAAQRAPQVSSLPDPMVALTTFVRSPETRVGSQELMASLSQRFPWFGKLKLREQAALLGAAAAEAKVEARRLGLVTEVRRLYYDLAFLDVYRTVIGDDRATLERYEELALTRYAAGIGLEQAVIKLQAEITKNDSRLLEIATRRATVVAALNSKLDRPADTAIESARLPNLGAPRVELDTVRELALANRPELEQADADIGQAEQRIALANKEYRPDINVGLTYTFVAGRSDPAGRAMPPPDDGKDILGFQVGLNLPIWKRRLTAGVTEAVELRFAAEESKRAVVAGIDGVLGEQVERLRITWQQLRLFEDVLDVQAEQSLLSAEAGYAAGSVGALDLLDAERVLLDVRTSTARSRADLAIALARLEGAVGEPLGAVVTVRGAR